MYLSHQPFTESADGIIVTFTSVQPFVIGSLVVTQGASELSGYIYDSSTSITFTTPPSAGDPLLWSGDAPAVTGDETGTVGFWVVSDFRDVYQHVTVTTSQLVFALESAHAVVQAASLPACYSNALDTSDANHYIFKRVQGELANYYLARDGITSEGITKYVEKYDHGVRSYEKQFGQGATDYSKSIYSSNREADILSGLGACLDQSYISEISPNAVASAPKSSPTFTSRFQRGRYVQC
jgi:hypothetical protein